jgi:hypothetical protein
VNIAFKLHPLSTQDFLKIFSFSTNRSTSNIVWPTVVIGAFSPVALQPYILFANKKIKIADKTNRQ